MYIKRAITPNLKSAAKEYPVVAIMGPRQSGKTTLARHVFPKHAYISFEDYDMRSAATNDPRGFLSDYPSKQGLILDEIQHVPELLSYIQTIVDTEKKRGFFILTGSQNFLMNQTVTQSLAGRVAIMTLLPLSIAELKQAKVLPENIETAIFTGSYPALYSEERSVSRLYQGYTTTYLERDVRQLRNIANLSIFKKFMGLCAGRTGQLVNFTELGNACGIDEKTVKAWLSLLETSYVIFLLHPYYKNFGKRLTQTPKLYFIDTGLACSLLRIKSANELINHSMRGGLVESFIISDLLKQQYNLERLPSLYFWRNVSGNEIDCIIDEGTKTIPVEIKASKTVIPTFFHELTNWRTLTEDEKTHAYIVYGGSKDQRGVHATVLGWHSAGNLLTMAEKRK